MIIPQFAHGEVVRVSLWVTQVLIFGALVAGGTMKLTMPVAKLSKMFSWTGQVSKPFLRFIGVVDLAGGLGILLPVLTNILPRLTVIAALGCTILQVLAIGFHARRGEVTETPFNFFLLALSILSCGAGCRRGSRLAAPDTFAAILPVSYRWWNPE